MSSGMIVFFIRLMLAYRTGKHVTIVTYSRGMEFSLEAAKELEAIGVEAEVTFDIIFPRMEKSSKIL